MAKPGPKKGAPNAGRPRVEINWKHAEALCTMHAFGKDVCSELGVSREAMNDACKREHGISFREFRDKNKGKGRNAVMGMLFRTAQKGSVAAQIFLAKNLCHMSDEGFTQDEDGQEVKRTFTLKIDGLAPTTEEPDTTPEP